MGRPLDRPMPRQPDLHASSRSSRNGNKNSDNDLGRRRPLRTGDHVSRRLKVLVHVENAAAQFHVAALFHFVFIIPSPKTELNPLAQAWSHAEPSRALRTARIDEKARKSGLGPNFREI